MADLMVNATPMLDDIFPNSSNATGVDLPKTVSLIFIFIFSLFGNVCTVAIVSRFKQHRLPDVLVIGLACTDLIATFVPVPMSLYSYITLEQFAEGSVACNAYGTVAQFTRYASALIVTLISLERYFAVNRPFVYRKYATPWKCIFVLICCWIIAFALAVVPALDSNTTITSHDGFCMFDFSSNYAISIVVYAGVQFVIVLLCFILVTANLLRVYRRRKELRVQGNYNQRSQARERENEVTFTRPNLTSRISDLGVALKRAAPLITEKFQLGVEAQFARMLFAVVALFYVSWTTLVILMVIAQIKTSQEGLSRALFWGIRLSVISLALNPLLYGLLARQYWMAYLYVLRRLFSWCCPGCVSPPLKDIFATARTYGGEIQGGPRQSTVQQRRMRERNYGSQNNRSMNGSLWSAKTGLPVLPHTTTASLDLLPQLEEGELLSTIPEESSMCDHSTYIPSVGELSSTVVIPHQARENYSSSTPKLDQKRPMTSSEHNLTDVGAYDRSPVEKHAGSHNPLAIIADIQGESAVTEQRRLQKRFPPLEAIDPLDLETGRVYNNPVYVMEKEKRERNPIRMSQSSPLSLLRNSLKAKHSPSLRHDSVTEPAHTPKPSTGERSRLAPTKKPVETTRSSPLAFLRGSKKKQKLRAANTLPPTLDPNSTEGEEPVITSIDDLDVVVDARHEALPVTSRQKHPTRASARTYSEMKQNLKQRPPSRPISSSHSFMDNPLTANTSARDEPLHTHDSAIGLAPRYQLSLSPIPPANLNTSPNSPTSSSNIYIPTVTISMSQPLPSSPKEAFLPSSNTVSSVTAVTPSQQPLPSPKKHTPSHNQPFFQCKSSVKELRERFESMSTPPTSPTPPSPASFPPLSPLPTSTQHHCMDTELDSGRESMVELAVTDI